MAFPPRPAEDADPWYTEREIFDQAVVDALGDDENFADNMAVALGQKAPLESPTFTGDPKVPTAAPKNKTTSAASTAFVEERGVRYADVFSTPSTDRTASINEIGNLVQLTANTAKTQRLPDDATAAFPIGSWVDYVTTGANELTFVAAGTATVLAEDNIAPRYVVVRAIKIAANTWLVGKQSDMLRAASNLETQDMTRNDVSVTPSSLASASTHIATANRLVRRDGNARFKSAAPSASDDVANKGYVDGLVIPEGHYQAIPPVGSFFTSAFWQSTNTSNSLRDRSSARMPLVVPQTIEIDQAEFNVSTLAATAGQTAKIDVQTLVGTTWTTLATLGTAIPLTDVTGIKVVSFTPLQLVPGVVYGFRVYEEQAYDTALRVTQGQLTGPGHGVHGNAFGVGLIMPAGANLAIIPSGGIPVIMLRRSA